MKSKKRLVSLTAKTCFGIGILIFVQNLMAVEGFTPSITVPYPHFADSLFTIQDSTFPHFTCSPPIVRFAPSYPQVPFSHFHAMSTTSYQGLLDFASMSSSQNQLLMRYQPYQTHLFLQQLAEESYFASVQSQIPLFAQGTLQLHTSGFANNNKLQSLSNLSFRYNRKPYWTQLKLAYQDQDELKSLHYSIGHQKSLSSYVTTQIEASVVAWQKQQDQVHVVPDGLLEMYILPLTRHCFRFQLAHHTSIHDLSTFYEQHPFAETLPIQNSAACIETQWKSALTWWFHSENTFWRSHIALHHAKHKTILNDALIFEATPQWHNNLYVSSHWNQRYWAGQLEGTWFDVNQRINQNQNIWLFGQSFLRYPLRNRLWLGIGYRYWQRRHEYQTVDDGFSFLFGEYQWKKIHFHVSVNNLENRSIHCESNDPYSTHIHLKIFF